MKIKILFAPIYFVFLIAFGSGAIATSQEPNKPNPESDSGLPTIPPIAEFTKTALVQLVGQGDASKLKIQKVVFTQKKESTTATVVAYRTEQRTRTVIVNGKNVDQTYTIQIPYTTDKTFENVTLETELKEDSIELDKCVIYNLAGEMIKPQNWKEKLTKPRTVFLVEEPLSKEYRLPEFYASVLKPDTLFLYVRQEEKEVEENEGKAAGGELK